MYESHAGAGYELAPETKALVAELFAGQSCCRCPGPAERMARGRFYCHAHYERKHQPAAAPRVHRCAVASDV